MTDSGQQETDLVGPTAATGRRRTSRRLGRYAGRALLLVVIPVGLITLLVAGSLATYRAVEAAAGHGTKGYFVSINSARGEFRLPDRQVTRPDVTFADPPPRLRARTILPALDTGDVTYVFPRHGSRHWEGNAEALALIVLALGAWCWFVPLRLRHNRRTESEQASADPSPPAKPTATTVGSAAADPAWTTSSIALLNGDISTKRINMALRTATDRAGYPLLITVGIPLTDTDRAMHPVSGESSRLAGIFEAVIGLIRGHGVLAASVADSGAWVFLIYTGSAEWLAAFEDQMRSEVPDHLVGFRAQRDPGWRVYRELWRAAPRKLRVHERIVLLIVLPVCAAVPAVRYGPAWAAAIAVAVEAWVLILAFGSRDRLISAQLAHPGLTWLALTGVFWTLLFPLGAFFVHPASPVVCAVGAALLAAAIIAALWPAQRRYYAKMRASAALRQPTAPTP